jgi:hypothetical protein
MSVLGREPRREGFAMQQELPNNAFFYRITIAGWRSFLQRRFGPTSGLPTIQTGSLVLY